MTIIAFKDGVLCADSLTESSGSFRRGNTDKIVRCRNGSLAGATGPSAACAQFLQWAFSHRDILKDHPGHLCAPDEFEAALFLPDGRVAYYDGSGEGPDFTVNEFHAMGNVGSMGVAIGVMSEGGTARRAVERAIEWTTCCGPPVQELMLNPTKEKRHGARSKDARRRGVRR
jgi:hypothetical protein